MVYVVLARNADWPDNYCRGLVEAGDEAGALGEARVKWPAWFASPLIASVNAEPLPEGRLRRMPGGSYVGAMGGYEVVVCRDGTRWILVVSILARQWTQRCVAVESPAEDARVAREWAEANPLHR